MSDKDIRKMFAVLYDIKKRIRKIEEVVIKEENPEVPAEAVEA